MSGEEEERGKRWKGKNDMDNPGVTTNGADDIGQAPDQKSERRASVFADVTPSEISVRSRRPTVISFSMGVSVYAVTLEYSAVCKLPTVFLFCRAFRCHLRYLRLALVPLCNPTIPVCSEGGGAHMQIYPAFDWSITADAAQL